MCWPYVSGDRMLLVLLSLKSFSLIQIWSDLYFLCFKNPDHNRSKPFLFFSTIMQSNWYYEGSIFIGHTRHRENIHIVRYVIPSFYLFFLTLVAVANKNKVYTYVFGLEENFCQYCGVLNNVPCSQSRSMRRVWIRTVRIGILGSRSGSGSV
jgi:hypothetical protein